MDYPNGLPRRWRRHWREPWRLRARRAWRFRRWLRRHGYLSPNFTQAEASGKGRNRLGSDVPASMLRRAQRHAFRLERLRHALGDRPVKIISWYRNPRHNRAVGGASLSQHMRAVATDHPRAWVESVGRTRFEREANRLFAKGGFGRYPSGSAHTDSRGWRARW